MTGISVLFNMKTEEACYIFGNMDTYRRINEQRYTGTSPVRRSYSDAHSRYAGSTDLANYTPTYSESLPRYHHSIRQSNYGYASDSVRDPYLSYPGLSSGGGVGLFSDPDTMSRYTTRSYDRHYDASPRSYDATTTRSYDSSSRLYDRGRKLPNSDRGTELGGIELGTSYISPRNYDTSTTRSYDVSTRKNDTNTGTSDATRRSPVRTSSLSDRDSKERSEDRDTPLETTFRRPYARQRINSGDSVGSHSSEKTESKGDSSLFDSYKSRYTERLEKEQKDDPRSPVSSWRRSGKFDDETLRQGVPVRERRERMHESDTAADGSRSRERQRSSEQVKSRETNGSHDPITVRGRRGQGQEEGHDRSLSESSETGSRDADDLLFNFRKALRRHAMSEDKKSEDGSRASSDVMDKAQTMKDNVRDSHTSLRLSHLEEKDEKTGISEKEERKPEKQKTSHKLARQKLVSDDLKAKYIEGKQEREKSEEEHEGRKYRSRRKQHPEEEISRMLGVTPDQDDGGIKVGKGVGKHIPKSDDVFVEATDSVRRERPSSDSSVLRVTSRGMSPRRKVAERSVSPEVKRSEDVEEEERSVVLEEPTISMKSAREMYSAVSEQALTPFGFAPGDIYRVKDTANKDASVTAEKSEKKSPRRFKRYTKAKSLELGQLSQNSEPKAEPQEPVVQDDITVGTALTMDDLAQMTRKERIARYKEERKKQLASISARFGEGDKPEFPSLFLSSSDSPEKELSPLARSRSLREESDSKVDLSPNISRSKSLKVDSSPSDSLSPASQKVLILSGLRLAELANQQTEDGEKRFNTDNIIDRLQALRKLRSEHLKHEGTTLDELQSKQSSKDFEPLEGSLKQNVPETIGISGKSVLLADQKFDRKKRDSERKLSDRDTDSQSGRDSEDSQRIKRRLPSLEDVLGTGAPTSDKSSHKLSSAKVETTDSKDDDGISVHQRQRESEKSVQPSVLESKQDRTVQRTKSDSEKIKARQKVPDLGTDYVKQYKPVKFDVADDTVHTAVTRQVRKISDTLPPVSSIEEPAHEKTVEKDKKAKTPSVSTELQKLILQEDAEEERKREKQRQMMLGVEQNENLDDETFTNKLEKPSSLVESPRLQKRTETKIPSPSMRRKEQKDSKEMKPPSSPRGERKHSGKMAYKPKDREETSSVAAGQDTSDVKSREVKDLRHFVHESEKQEGQIQRRLKDSNVTETPKVTKISYRDLEKDQKEARLMSVKDEQKPQKESKTLRKGEVKEQKESKQQQVTKETEAVDLKLLSPRETKAPRKMDSQTKIEEKRAAVTTPSKDVHTSKPTKISYRDQQKQKEAEKRVAVEETESLAFRTDFVDRKTVESSVPSQTSLPFRTESQGPEQGKVKSISHREVIETAKQSKMAALKMEKTPKPVAKEIENRGTRQQEKKTSAISMTTDVAKKFEVDKQSPSVTESPQALKSETAKQTTKHLATTMPQDVSTPTVVSAVPSKTKLKRPTKIEVSASSVTMAVPAGEKVTPSTSMSISDVTLLPSKVQKVAPPSSVVSPSVSKTVPLVASKISQEHKGPSEVQKPLTSQPTSVQSRSMEKKESKKKPEVKEEVKVTKHKKQESSSLDRESRIAKELGKKMEKQKEDLQILDTSLDDILNRNVEYLSDLEPPDFARGRTKQKLSKRPVSVHDPPRMKRVLRKKLTQRSKSEDRSHFKGKLSDSDDDVDPRRSKGTEDIGGKVTPAGLRAAREGLRKDRGSGKEVTAPGEGETTHVEPRLGRLEDESVKPATTSDWQREKEFQQREEKTVIQPVQSKVSKLSPPPVTNVSLPTKEKTELLKGSLDSVSAITGKKEVAQSTKQTGSDDFTGETVAGKISIETQSARKVFPQVSKSIPEDDTEEAKLDEISSDVANQSSVDIPSGMASDTSERSERRRFISRHMDAARESESSKITTDSDQSISSTISEGSRKRRKDKTSLRKSKLNESSEDVSSPRRRDSGSDSSRSSKVGVRRTASSRTTRETPVHDGRLVQEEPCSRKRNQAFITLTTQNTAPSFTRSEKTTSDTTQPQSNKHPVNSDQSGLHSRAIHATVLDSHAVLPSKFSLPSKVSTAISKLTEASDKSRGESPTKVKEDDVSRSPKRIHRGSNFSQLLQKFSSSDASGSEKSDNESQNNRRKLLLKRQEAYAVSSGSSDETRRTPERTQSLRAQKSPSPVVQKEAPSVQRSSSFKSDFMKRRFSPEPVPRRQLPATPQQSDKPTPELADVLTKRNQIVKKQQEEGEVIERERIHDGKVEKGDRYSSAKVDEVIQDSEVLQLLQSRRKETDSSVETVPEKASQPPGSTMPIATSSTVKTQSTLLTEKEPTRFEAKETPPLKSQSSVTSSTEISLMVAQKSKVPTKENIPSESVKTDKPPQPVVKIKGKEHPPVSPTEMKETTEETSSSLPALDLSAIDTSLSVLESVSVDMGVTDKNVANVEEQNLEKTLANVNLSSSSDVVKFIKSVETEKLEAKINSSREDYKINVDVVKTEKERPLQRNVEVQETERPSKVVEILQTRRSPEKQTKRDSSPVGLDQATRSDIIKKLHRETTPERTSPVRTGPIKVTSPVHSVTSAGLKRTESLGRSETERPKGILKRTPSLHKSGVVVDPELAMVLRNRRAKHGDVEEEDETKHKIGAEEDIRKTREAESQRAGEDVEEDKKASVAELVFHMQTKIEEVRSAPITPKSWSGVSTPKGLRQRSGNHTPKGQFSFDGGAPPLSAVSGSQLIERLTSLEGRQENLSNKRRKFQQRKQDDWRTRTQPVTLEEIQSADSLQTVQQFRAEVLRKASISTFESLQKQDSGPVGRKTEFPQHFRRDKRPRAQRHKTLPITAAELSALPEDNALEETDTFHKRFDFGARDSKADSGILSGSDGEYLEKDSDSARSVSMDENISEDDPVKLSVSAKASMFKQIEEKLKEKPDKKSASGAKRYIDRKKRERSRTQPVTEDEVKTAVELEFTDASQGQSQTQEQGETANGARAETGEIAEQGDGDAPDELSRQSLADKVKLFTTIEAEKKAVKKPVPPPPRRKNRKLASRFATQPVTYDEVEKAAKISPLALSLVKPPDPELLKTLPIQAQRELMAQHAKQSLSQPGSRSGSQPSSRSTSVGDLSAEAILKSQEREDLDLKQGLPKQDLEKSDVSERRGILKSHDFLADLEKKVGKGILKPDENITVSAVKKEHEPKGILKHGESESAEAEVDLEPRGILKPPADAGFMDQLKGVLKAETKGSLKKDSSFESSQGAEHRSILKKESSFETKKMEPEKSVLRKSSKEMEESPIKGILRSGNKGESGESDDDVLTPRSASPTLASTEHEETSDTPVSRERSSRRRFNRDNKTEVERYRTQPAEVPPENSSPESTSRRKVKYTGRHLTQPITPDEKREAESKTEMPEIKTTGSIHDRLNALKKSGEEEWKKRVSRPLDLDTISPPETPPLVKMREKSSLAAPRPSSIADRLSLLDNAQTGWRGRVGETDVKQFTVAHKIAASGQSLGESPLVARLKKNLSKDSDSSETELTSPTTPTKESNKIPLLKEVICTDIPLELEEKGKPSSLATIKSVTDEEEKGPTNIEIPRMDEELDTFFQRPDTASILEDTTVDVTVDDFNDLFISANDILNTTRKIRPKRRHVAKSRNPLKTMSVNLEVKSEYTEVVTGVAERELKRVKTAQISQGSGFAVEALAGLASKENFSKVELRKTDSNGSSTPGGNLRYDPYLPLMLIHIKGRRRVQCRLVEPTASCLNSGDCFVLVTPDKIIQWIGDFCNVIEKAKAADVADFVKQKRDLGCKHALAVATVEEKKGRLGAGRQFYDLLGGQKDYLGCGPAEEDELYENHIIETNMIFRLDQNKLLPMKEYWGNQPKYEMLKNDELFVFDFGTELYVWQGKAVSPNQRKIGLRLAQQLWEQGYDYSACDINPVSPLLSEEQGGAPSQSSSRPSWALFGKVNQNMETILFREKFSDWPDTSRLIKVKSQEEVSGSKLNLADLKAYDATLMVPINTAPVSIVLEGSHVGRGNKWAEDMEGFVREQNITTLKVLVWHVLEYDHYQVEEQSYGQFHEGDTYVVRWQYMITTAGAKNLKGQASRHSQLGRERCAYFFWQGKQSTINEKGASALMTVELDEERGPQVRVSEGKEPPCFLNLFEGRTVIHIGKREDESSCTQGDWRFYCLRNEYENEMCLIETKVSASSLRSLSSFLCLNVRTGSLIVWHGNKSPDHTRKLAVKAAEKLKQRCPLEVGLHKDVKLVISEMEEGAEMVEFWRALDCRIGDREQYCSLLRNPESFTHTLRLFHMTSVSGVFEVIEVLNPSRSPDLISPFPVLQDDLYKASQPALFLIDNGHEVYLWQGWWPEGDEEQENVLTGSAMSRFTTDRRCAMETTLHYCREIKPDNPPPAYVVYAGLEPLRFTNLFPVWSVESDVREINLKEGKTDGEIVLVKDLLQKVTKTRYTFAELEERPLPEGVDPLKLESYLSDEEFEKILEMNKEEFYALPGWKQSKLKQNVGLF